jgi:predicted nucleic acid-binding protein
VALFVQTDRCHPAAAEFLRSHPGARFVLTELVLAETVTLLRLRAGAGRAAAVARDLLKSRRYEIIFADAELIEGALGRLERFADKRLSLADCVSFETIERLGLDGAFTFDRDFRDCGFTAVP